MSGYEENNSGDTGVSGHDGAASAGPGRCDSGYSSFDAFFGFTYESLESLLLFFMAVMILGFPLELVSKALPKVLLSQRKLNLKQARVLFVIMDSLSTITVMRIVDEQMSGVYASDTSVLVVAVVMALLLMHDLKQDKVQ